MVKILLIFAILGGAMYVLYINGYMVMSNKRAISFVGSKRCNKASFTSCNGYIKCIFKVKESRNYTFDLDLQLSKGDMQVELLDECKNEIARLTSDKPAACIGLTAGKRYYIVYRFAKASGKYELKHE